MKQHEMDGLAARARIVAEQLLASGSLSLPEYLNYLAVAADMNASEVLTDTGPTASLAPAG